MTDHPFEPRLDELDDSYEADDAGSGSSGDEFAEASSDDVDEAGSGPGLPDPTDVRPDAEVEYFVFQGGRITVQERNRILERARAALRGPAGYAGLAVHARSLPESELFWLYSDPDLPQWLRYGHQIERWRGCLPPRGGDRAAWREAVTTWSRESQLGDDFLEALLTAPDLAEAYYESPAPPDTSPETQPQQASPNHAT